MFIGVCVCVCVCVLTFWCGCIIRLLSPYSLIFCLVAFVLVIGDSIHIPPTMIFAYLHISSFLACLFSLPQNLIDKPEALLAGGRGEECLNVCGCIPGSSAPGYCIPWPPFNSIVPSWFSKMGLLFIPICNMFVLL